MALEVSEDVLRAAFAAALAYHPLFHKPISGQNELYEKVRSGKKLAQLDTVVGDCFANVYNTILRYPPDLYEDFLPLFFVDCGPYNK